MGTWIQDLIKTNDSTAFDNYVRNLVKPLPQGGAAGEVLTKNTNANYDVKWAAGGGGGGISQAQTLARISMGV